MSVRNVCTATTDRSVTLQTLDEGLYGPSLFAQTPTRMEIAIWVMTPLTV